ncbi:DNA-processing protein DprA [Patescibacteria group bacterium]|nr:DNA-processing protein DprA [Patescibacteria group bacterium]
MKSDIKYLMALSQINGLGPVILGKLLEAFNNDVKACFKASFLDFHDLKVSEKIAALIIENKKTLNPDKLIEQLDKEDIKIMTFFNEHYPTLLKEIYAPPLVLYYRGNDSALEKLSSKENWPTLAVVGSRKISNYGKTIMTEILAEIIREKVIIVSGLAMGVDSLAHQLTLDYHGQTVTVVGSGLAWDYLYPQANKKLTKDILKNDGLLFSEFPPFMQGLPANFPRRNRIISGLAQATLIIEASLTSGALITAKYALEQNREVLAVPGAINSSTSQGTNYLIQNGAKLVAGAEDIRQSLNLNFKEKKTINDSLPLQATDDELMILKILNISPLHIDKIIENCTLETAQVNSLLLQLELKGWIKNIGGQNYIKN